MNPVMQIAVFNVTLTTACLIGPAGCVLVGYLSLLGLGATGVIRIFQGK